MEPPDADAILRDNFAPWVQDLGLTVESLSAGGEATLRLPWSDRLAREGGARPNVVGRRPIHADQRLARVQEGRSRVPPGPHP